jgi:hypothetical protein
MFRHGQEKQYDTPRDPPRWLLDRLVNGNSRNQRQLDLLEHDPALAATMWGLVVRGRDDRRTAPDQWRSMLLFRAVPSLFALVWAT